MPPGRQDILVGSALALIAAAWCAIVLKTVPPGTGGGDIGPRAFPLLLGVAMGLLSLFMVVSRLLAPTQETDPAAQLLPDTDEEARQDFGQTGTFMVAAVFLLIFGYGAALPRIGFVLSTILVVALTMAICLRIRSWRWIAGMSLGIAFGCWLIFGQILGIPLARGSWINLG